MASDGDKDEKTEINLKKDEINLIAEIEACLTTGQLKNALALVKDETNLSSLQTNCSDIITAVIKFLTHKSFSQNSKLYNGCEEVLKVIAEKANEGDVILELLEVIDTSKDDNIVVSILKALQLSLLKQTERRVRSLEWCLNSIQSYVSDLPLAPELRQRLDNEEETLLEEDDEVRRIVSFYFYMFLFYEPLLEQIMANPLPTETNFRFTGISRRNVLVCFIIQLFGEPFAYLDLTPASSEGEKSEKLDMQSYSRQCADTMIKQMSTLLPDPFQLIGYAEKQTRWPYILPENDDVIMNAPPPSDIFLIEEKTPLIGLAVFYYAMIAEDLMPANRPKIYLPSYIFEMGLYLVTELLKTTEDALHVKGIRLCKKLLGNLGSDHLSDSTLDLDVHIKFVNHLMIVLNTTQVRRNSKAGVDLLTAYILKFESIEAKYFHIRRLLRTANNNKLCGYLVTMYKNITAEQLDLAANCDKKKGFEMSEFCSGEKLKTILLENICIVPKGIETDILQYNDLIVAALNILRFVVLRDQENLTKIWDFIDDLQKKFLNPLRSAIDYSRAHYQLEEKRINTKKSPSLEVDIAAPDGSNILPMTIESKLQILTIGRNTFDLIESLISRLNECIEMKTNATKNSNDKIVNGNATQTLESKDN